MKNNCEIIRDLLPLYCDNVCSEASKKLVEEHIDECAECRNEALKIKSEFSSKHIDEEKTKSQIFKKIKKKITIKRIVSTVLSVLLTVCALFSGIKIINRTSPIEYYDGLVRVYETGNSNEIYYTGNENSYHKVNCVQFEITENGLTEEILCFYLEESIYSKHFKDKYSNHIREVQTEPNGSIQGVTAIYYMVYGDSLIEDFDKLWSEIQKNGKLLWKAEK